MTPQEYTQFKLKYLDDFKTDVQEMLDKFSVNHHDSKMNNLIAGELSDLYLRLRSIIYFPDYNLPD